MDVAVRWRPTGRGGRRTSRDPRRRPRPSLSGERGLGRTAIEARAPWARQAGAREEQLHVDALSCIGCSAVNMMHRGTAGVLRQEMDASLIDQVVEVCGAREFLGSEAHGLGQPD